MQPRLLTFDTLYDASLAVAENISRIITQAVFQKGTASFVLSGGATPELLYQILASPEYARRIPWQHVHIFWGDERCIPPDSEESNFGMAYRALLSHVCVKEAHIHRIFGEAPDRFLEAKRYELEIRKLMGCEPNLPLFDVVLLGMGADGHTASLFPGLSCLEEQVQLVSAVTAPREYMPRDRITLTVPAFINSGNILFLIAGSEKKSIADSIVADPVCSAAHYPAARVGQPLKTCWYVAT
ncbi:MAG: 6-phosphogluconolactonase [Deltaproteobacteria bacterium]|nr:6-phosphogluconolactonase [Deltaproteobacteria bacterium]